MFPNKVVLPSGKIPLRLASFASLKSIFFSTFVAVEWSIGQVTVAEDVTLAETKAASAVRVLIVLCILNQLSSPSVTQCSRQLGAHLRMR